MFTYRVKYSIAGVFFLVVLFLSFSFLPAYATDYTSSSFIIRDPVISISGGTSTSGSFELFENLGNVAIGTSSSASFELRSGFLYFPTVTTPVVTPSAGDGSVTLTWTASTGSLGWTVGGYSIGQSTTAGGTYSYSSAGNVLTKAVSGLTNGTTYYFVILPEDGLGARIATSSEVSATPAAGSSPSPSPSSGGGGGGGSRERDDISKRPELAFVSADFNYDGRVDLKDLSILLYYWDQPIAIIQPYDLNDDNVIDLKDISILFYYWTR